MDYIIIDKTSKIPLYLQIADSIRHHINLGNIPHGTQLPTETTICLIYEVSVIVVKHAYDELVKKGLVTRIRGKGTFVNTLKPYKLDLSGGIIAINQVLGEAKRTVISYDKVSNHSLNAYLGLNDDEFFYYIKTVTSINNRPILFQYIHLPEKYFPNLKKEYIKHQSMFELLIRTYKLDPKNLKQTYRPLNLPAEIAMILDTQKAVPGHFIRSQVENSNGDIYAFFAIYAPADSLEFEVSV